MTLIELSSTVSLLALSLLVFGTLAWRYKTRTDKQLVLSSIWAGVLFISMFSSAPFVVLLQPLIAIALVRNVHFFFSQIRPPRINESKRDYGMTVVVALLGLCFCLGVAGTLLRVNFGAQALFIGILIAHGVVVIVDDVKKSRGGFPMVGIVIYGLGIAIPQIFVIILESDYSISELEGLSIISYFCVTAGLMFLRMEEVLQHRDKLLKAEMSSAREGVRITDLQMSLTLSRILENAAHSLGTPSVLLGTLREVIGRKGVAAVEDRIVESLTCALEKIAESKGRIVQVHRLIKTDHQEGIGVEQVIANVVRLFEHSLSGVNVNIRCVEGAQVHHLKSVLLHSLVMQITLHTYSLQRMGVHDRPELNIVVMVSDRWLTLIMSEDGRVSGEFEGLRSDQLTLKTNLESLLRSVGGEFSIVAPEYGSLESRISIELH